MSLSGYAEFFAVDQSIFYDKAGMDNTRVSNFRYGIDVSGIMNLTNRDCR